MSSVQKAGKKDNDSEQLSIAVGMDLGGLDDDLAALMNKPQDIVTNTGKPQELLLEQIDEDPNQPRKEDNPGFSMESLKELAATISGRGVKSPISVRVNPEAENRYLINHGARRYRASKLAGKKTIPAFIDNDYSQFDQIIENLQRDELTPREIADFIGRELAKGKKKGEIAKEIGKSAAFITQHVTLLDLPEPIADAFNSGRARDVTVINELVTAYKKSPNEVITWLDDESQELTRGSVKLLREFLDDKRRQNNELEGNNFNVSDQEIDVDHEDDERNLEGSTKKQARLENTDKIKKAIVMVEHDGRKARIILNRRPLAAGHAWLMYEDDGQKFSADLTRVRLLALMEG